MPKVARTRNLMETIAADRSLRCHSRSVVRLFKLGAAILEPTLAHIGRTTDPDVLHALARGASQ